MAKLWAGRTDGETDKLADDFNSSIRFDHVMYRQDITGSMAHAAMLGAQGIISGSAHILCDILNNFFDAFEAGKNDVALENFTKLYRFCGSWARFGRIHPNPVMRPAIEKVTGIKVGPARQPLYPIRPEEEAYLDAILKELGKI